MPLWQEKIRQRIRFELASWAPGKPFECTYPSVQEVHFVRHGYIDDLGHTHLSPSPCTYRSPLFKNSLRVLYPAICRGQVVPIIGVQCLGQQRPMLVPRIERK